MAISHLEDPDIMTSTLKLLIVEDDPMMQLGLEQTLGSVEGYEILGIADDGPSAIKMASELQPELIVMDIGLPRLDGIATTQHIKAAQPDVHVVMLTSHTTENEVVAALASGADAYCIKGVSIERLKSAIEAAREGATYLDPQVARKIMDHLHPPTPNTNIGELSEREFEVLELMVQGLSNPEIGSRLYLSPNTVKTHVRGIMNKLAVDDRVQAAVVALRTGLVK